MVTEVSPHEDRGFFTISIHDGSGSCVLARGLSQAGALTVDMAYKSVGKTVLTVVSVPRETFAQCRCLPFSDRCCLVNTSQS